MEGLAQLSQGLPPADRSPGAVLVSEALPSQGGAWKWASGQSCHHLACTGLSDHLSPLGDQGHLEGQGFSLCVSLFDGPHKSVSSAHLALSTEKSLREGSFAP